MDDYVLVLNAGSSSLKFCVYQPRDNAELEMLVGGQIEGIGSAPLLKAKNQAGKQIANQNLDSGIKDGYAAISFLAKLRNHGPLGIIIWGPKLGKIGACALPRCSA